MERLAFSKNPGATRFSRRRVLAAGAFGGASAAALALIADYHTGHTRSRAVGLHQMAIYCGVIAGGFGGYVADEPALGWRFAFDACGLFGMLYALPLLALLRDPPKPEGIAIPAVSHCRIPHPKCGGRRDFRPRER